MEKNELLIKLGTLLDNSLPMHKRETIESEIDAMFNGKSVSEVVAMDKPALVYVQCTTAYGVLTKTVSFEIPKEYLPKNHTATDNNTIDYLLS